MKINLNNMQFHSYIGFYPEERQVGQDISVTASLLLNNQDVTNYLTDDLNQTINYGVVYDIIANLAQGHHDIKLLETLAAKMIQAIRAAFPEEIDTITIQIKKFNLPINGILDNAEIELEG